jgi:hypothetical protein
VDACDRAAREAKEGRKESHKNIIAHDMYKKGSLGFKGVPVVGDVHGSIHPDLPALLGWMGALAERRCGLITALSRLAHT